MDMNKTILTMQKRIALLEKRLAELERWKLEEMEVWADVMHERQIQHDHRLAALEEPA